MIKIPNQTLHGKWNGEAFVYTDMSAGRIGRSSTLIDHSCVIAVTELSGDRNPDDSRTVLLGDGVIYQYEANGIRVKNQDGKLYMEVETWGSQQTESWDLITPGLQVGGSMPTTVFDIKEGVGFAIIQ